jgi:hypothetical protein
MPSGKSFEKVATSILPGYIYSGSAVANLYLFVLYRRGGAKPLENLSLLKAAS